MTTCRLVTKSLRVPSRISFVIFDGFELLDLAGPFEVFQQANRLSGGYSCEVISRSPGLVRSDSSLQVYAGYGVEDRDPCGIDTLVVAGGSGVDAARDDSPLVEWVGLAGAAARRVTSVCSGVFLLAAAGLVSGRRVTSHWGRAAQLAREHPELVVDCDPIFIKDGHVWTSAGVTAGMDLALALIDDDLGRDVALEVARELVLFLRRPGSQSQYSVPLWSPQPSTDSIRAVVSAVQADPGARHTIGDLAGHARMSPRQLQRRFTTEIGTSPGAYVERIRVEAARRALAESADPLDSIARRCGFGTGETLRRVFHKHLGASPSEYRNRFQSPREERNDDVRAAHLR